MLCHLVVYLIIGVLLIHRAGSSREGGFQYSSQQHWSGTCSNNTGHQSPINIQVPDNTVKVQDPLLVPAATKDVTMEMMKDDHTVKVTFPEGIDGEFEFKIPTTNGVKTKALQLHLHWGQSEHMINFKWYKLESHLVTLRVDDGQPKLTVFGRVFELGEANPMVEKMIEAAERNATQVEGFDLTVLYPPSIRHILAYSGSLTTPPCTEGVSWFVVQEPLTISEDQVKFLDKLDQISECFTYLMHFLTSSQ
ncbi:hypothetical protein ACHWQZ_G012654 [Mnemiopsis leidyi]